MTTLCFSFALSLLFLSFFLPSLGHSFHDDRQSLLEFKSSITSDPHHSMANWSSDVPYCNWSGVTCRHHHQMDRVIALNLTAMDLKGIISPSLGNLSFLHSLTLRRNMLHGYIPLQLGRLFRLRTLKLSFNQLDGNIPIELGSLTHLQVLSLGENSLTECNALQKVRHRNLVRVITSCSNLHFKALMFQFMCNGSLEKHLYPNKDDNNDKDVCELGLRTRLDIAIDVAHAMEYLHHDSFVQVVHCNIKPSNVLLDVDMVGHVTDFGIAKLIGATSNDSLTSTVALKGSVGYIPPEYGLGERVSSEGDVYSFGILLLEMITRKRPTSDMFVGDLNLHKWVNLAFPDRVKEVIDNDLLRKMDGDEIGENDAYKCILSFLNVGLLCSKDSPKERPTMRDVSTMLESLREDLVGNSIASRSLKQSISALLANSNYNAIRDNAVASNDASCTF